MNIGDIVTLTDDITLEQAVTGRIVRMGKRWVVIEDAAGVEWIGNRLNAKAGVDNLSIIC